MPKMPKRPRRTTNVPSQPGKIFAEATALGDARNSGKSDASRSEHKDEMSGKRKDTSPEMGKQKDSDSAPGSSIHGEVVISSETAFPDPDYFRRHLKHPNKGRPVSKATRDLLDVDMEHLNPDEKRRLSKRVSAYKARERQRDLVDGLLTDYDTLYNSVADKTHKRNRLRFEVNELEKGLDARRADKAPRRN